MRSCKATPSPHFELWRQDVLRTIAKASAEGPQSSPMFGPNYILIGNTPYYIGQFSRSSRLPGRIKSEQAEIIRAGFSWNSTNRYQQPEPPGSNNYLSSLFQAMDNNLNRGFLEYAEIQARIDEVIVACAIERYRLEQGALPNSLNDLRAKYLSTIPTDPMNGNPLKYVRTPKGYLLYSVGQDGIDNGGVPEMNVAMHGRQPEIKGDWVWIYKK
jgi:hypothetical protein